MQRIFFLSRKIMKFLLDTFPMNIFRFMVLKKVVIYSLIFLVVDSDHRVIFSKVGGWA